MSNKTMNAANKEKSSSGSKENIRKIIEERKKYRERKPKFLRWLWWKFPKFKNNLKWKRPKGKDNPIRLHLKGYSPMASIGYGAKSEIRSLHPSGLRPVVIHSLSELDLLDPSKHLVYISSSLGLRKRLEVIEKAKIRGFRIANA